MPAVYSLFTGELDALWERIAIIVPCVLGVAGAAFWWWRKRKQTQVFWSVLPRLAGPYDFIFMDAAKGQYIRFLPEVLRLLAGGGMLVSDNVLQDGDILESHYAVERRNRTIYKRMREYLYELTHREDLVTTILPIGDGLALTVKKCVK